MKRFHFLPVILLSLAASISANANDIQRETGWSAIYGTHISLPEPQWTPKPDRIGDRETAVLSLEGTWRFLYRGTDEMEFPIDANGQDWVDLPVPSQPVAYGYPTGGPNQPFTYWHYRTFDLPADFAGHRVILRCDGTDGLTTVFINGKEVIRHDGVRIPFEVDITDQIQCDQSNAIAMKIKDSDLAAFSMDQDLGGITRAIVLMAVPTVNISRFHFETDFDTAYRDANLKTSFTLRNQSAESLNHAEVKLKLSLGDETVMTVTEPLKALGLKSGETRSFELDFPVAEPLQWDTEHPTLYNYSIELRVNGRSVETVKRRVGFREIEIRQNKAFLNNKRLRLHGVMHHFFDASQGVVVSDEQHRADVETYRNANINFIRCGRSIPEAFVEACDELGILTSVYPNMSFVRYSNPLRPWTKTRLERIAEESLYPFIENVVRINLQLVERYRSHSSVFAWEIANESDYTPFYDAAARAVKETDQTRPVWLAFSHLQGLGIGTADIYNSHYRLLSMPPLDKPLMYTEWCHLEAYMAGELDGDPGLRDAWDYRIKQHYDYMYAHESVLGGCIFNGIDYWHTFPAVGHQYGLFGLIDIWRRIKPEYWHAKKALSPIRIEKTKYASSDLQGGELAIEVENRFCFTNLADIEKRIVDATGQPVSSSVDIEPQSIGVLHLRRLRADQFPLSLGFYRTDGHQIDRYLLTFLDANTDEEEPTAGENWALSAQGDRFTVTGRSSIWSFDRKNGDLVVTLAANGERLIRGLPKLVITPNGMRNRGNKQVTGHTIPPNFLSNWKFAGMTATREDETIRVTIEDAYTEAVGTMRIDFRPDGTIATDYDYAWLGYQQRDAVDIDYSKAREIGVAIELSDAFRHYSWKRRDQWSVYPDDHPMRLEAENVLPYRGPAYVGTDPKSKPRWPWALDQIEAGTAEFRSTKYQFITASLLNAMGQGILARSTGCQHVRAAMNPENQSVYLFVNDHSRGGNCDNNPASEDREIIGDHGGGNGEVVGVMAIYLPSTNLNTTTRLTGSATFSVLK